MNKGSGHPVTPTYVFFYILFSPDTWRILIGVAFSAALGPFLLKPDMALPARAVVFVMVAAIGWSLSGKPALWITVVLKKALGIRPRR